MSADGAYERVCAELHSIHFARRKADEILADLCAWLSDPQLERHDHETLAGDGGLGHWFRGKRVFSCSVSDSVLVLRPDGSEPQQFDVADLKNVKSAMVRLIARVVDAARVAQPPTAARRPEPAPRQVSKPLYPV